MCLNHKLKAFLYTLGLTQTASATYAAIHRKVSGSSVTALIILNEEMNDILKILQTIEEFGLSIEGIKETIKNEAK